MIILALFEGKGRLSPVGDRLSVAFDLIGFLTFFEEMIDLSMDPEEN